MGFVLFAEERGISLKKIPTLFDRNFSGGDVKVTPVVTKGYEWVLEGEGVATVKYDGACCAIINGELYRRYNTKHHGKPVPEGAIKCQEEADPVTGHLPCWVQCDRFNPADKWFWNAYDDINNTYKDQTVNHLPDGTYEAVGLHFQSNPYRLDNDTLIRHGEHTVDLPRSFEGIRKWLSENYFEGIVFWKDGEPKCKIKRSDFGFEWNNKKGRG